MSRFRFEHASYGELQNTRHNITVSWLFRQAHYIDWPNSTTEFCLHWQAFRTQPGPCYFTRFVHLQLESDPNREGPWRITSRPDLCSVHTGTQSEHKRRSIHKARWPVYIGQTIYLTTAFLTTVNQERCLLNTNLDYHPRSSFCRPYNYNVDLWRFYEPLFMGWRVISILDGCQYSGIQWPSAVRVAAGTAGHRLGVCCILNFNIPPLIFQSADIPMALWSSFSPWNFQRTFILTPLFPDNSFCLG